MPRSRHRVTGRQPKKPTGRAPTVTSEGVDGSLRHLYPVLTAGAVVMLVAPVGVAWSAAQDSAEIPRTMRVSDSLDVDGTESTAVPQASAPTADPASASVTGTTTGPASTIPSVPFPARVPTGAHGKGPAPSGGWPWAISPRASRPIVTVTARKVPTRTVTATSAPTTTSPGPTATPTSATVTETAAPAAPVTTVTVTETASTPPTVTVTVPGTPWTRAPGGGVYQPGTYQPGTAQQVQPFDVSGWHSGASGKSAIDGSFGSWRGKPVQVIAIWGDTTAEEQTQISALGEVDGFDGDLDVAVGALAEGETWEQAARGAYAERWRKAVRTIAAHRSGKPGTTYVRFAHELNGSWFDWKVTSGNLAAFKTAWRLYHDILAQEYPAAKLVFSPNNGSHSDVPVSEIYPGNDLVDVIGVDFYDGWPSIKSQEDWDKVLYATEKGDQPRGVGAWQRFAAAHGKPLSFPEWGLQKGDHPAFIKAMHEFLSANAAKPGDVAGKVVYDVYFDIAHGGNKGFMLTGSANPQAAQLYRSLQWGS